MFQANQNTKDILYGLLVLLVVTFEYDAAGVQMTMYSHFSTGDQLSGPSVCPRKHSPTHCYKNVATCSQTPSECGQGNQITLHLVECISASIQSYVDAC